MVKTQYEHRTSADTHLQYHCAYKNKSYVALNVANVFVPQVKDTNMPQGWLNPDGIAINFLLYNFLFVSGIFNLILYPK